MKTIGWRGYTTLRLFPGGTKYPLASHNWWKIQGSVPEYSFVLGRDFAAKHLFSCWTFVGRRGISDNASRMKAPVAEEAAVMPSSMDTVATETVMEVTAVDRGCWCRRFKCNPNNLLSYSQDAGCNPVAAENLFRLAKIFKYFKIGVADLQFCHDDPEQNEHCFLLLVQTRWIFQFCRTYLTKKHILQYQWYGIL